MLSKSIRKLVQYGIETGLTPECEKNYTINLLLDVFREEEYTEPEEVPENVDLEETLGELLDEAVKRGLIEDSVVYRDLFDTRLMNCLMPRPAQVQKEFWDRYQNSPQKATDYFYHNQSVKTGKGSKGHCSSKKCKGKQLPKMSSLP